MSVSFLTILLFTELDPNFFAISSPKSVCYLLSVEYLSHSVLKICAMSLPDLSWISCELSNHGFSALVPGLGAAVSLTLAKQNAPLAKLSILKFLVRTFLDTKHIASIAKKYSSNHAHLNPLIKILGSGTFVQWISGAQLHFVITTPPEVELSSTSIFLCPAYNQHPLICAITSNIPSFIFEL